MSRFLTALLGFGLLASSVSATGPEYRSFELQDGSVLRYALVLPEGFDEASTYSALLALPPGPQSEAMVEAGLSRYWGAQASARSWLVVSPIAPEGRLFHRGGEAALVELMDEIARSFRIEGGKFHLAGASNGGLSAFAIAGRKAERFHSLTVLPGFPPEPEDFERLSRLKGIPIAMFVGGEDGRWIEPMERAESELREMGSPVYLEKLPGEGHVPPSLTSDRILDALESARVSARGRSEEERRVALVLDDFHDAATKADEARYFGHFAPEGVFLGTDPSERWTVGEFRAWAKPYFQRDSAWVFVPRNRFVYLGSDQRVAWFDEVVDSAHYGECRGTGALRKIDGAWKVAHYNLTVPVPNDLLAGVVEQIRGKGPDRRTTRIILVRHAEKVLGTEDPDPPLTEEGVSRAKRLARMLASVEVSAAYASEYDRTLQTILPSAAAAGIEPIRIAAKEVKKLVRLIATEHRGETVLVCGHSNTLPSILEELGVEAEIRIDESDYENLFLVALEPARPVGFLHLRYGE